MEKTIIGDTRTFENLSGVWIITEIHKNQNMHLILTLNLLKCHKCGESVFEPRGYIFNYLEKIEYHGVTKYLGISKKDERCVILTDHLSIDEIESKIKKE